MPGIFDQAVINQVQQANDIVDVVSEHVSLKKRGREMVGLCPFHDDHRPSLYVNSSKQIFKCFACGAGGGVFTFVQMRENLTFPQAVERLAERVGIKLRPKEISKTPARDESLNADPNSVSKVNTWAKKYFQDNLYDEKKGKYVREYIAKRKITKESVKKWGLGLSIDSPDDLIKTARRKNIPIKLLEQAGLVNNQNQDRFVNRLMFPITDVTARVIGFGGRRLNDTGAKYINSPTTVLFDKSNSLYGLQHARDEIVATSTAIVVEGYTDCIMAHQVGCKNVVATLGTSLTTGHGQILRRYAKKVVLIFDSDVAGIEAANRALEICLSQRIDIKLASVPEGKDPCDFILAAGGDGFEQLVASAVDVFEFKWNRLQEKFGSDESLTGRRAAIDEYLQAIATSIWSGYMPVIDRGLILNRLSKIIGLDSKQINAELTKRISRLSKGAGYEAETRNQKDIDLGEGLSAAAQREVLEVLLNAPQLFEIVKEKITAEYFDIPKLKQAASILFETLLSDDKATLSNVLTRTESVDVGRSLVELAHAGEQKGNYKERLVGALDVLQRCRTDKRRKEIKTIEDQKQFLQHMYEHTGKHNPHNVGMV
jgi:DNA primase